MNGSTAGILGDPGVEGAPRTRGELREGLAGAGVNGQFVVPADSWVGAPDDRVDHRSSWA